MGPCEGLTESPVEQLPSLRFTASSVSTLVWSAYCHYIRDLPFFCI